MFGILLILFYTGCENEDGSIKNIFVPKKFSYKNLSKLKGKAGKLINVKKSKEIILDSGEDVIGMIWSLKFVDKMFLVVDLMRSRSCYLFSENGKLLGKIGRIGQGPGEYTFPRAACISGDRIFVQGGYRIIIYKTNGDLIKTMNKPFRGIGNGLYPGPDGSVFALCLSRDNRTKKSIFHLDKNGNMINNFSPYSDVPDIFDTFAPQTGLCLENNRIYQFFNFKEEILVFDFAGNKTGSINLSSPFYTKPDFKDAKHVRGHKEEFEYRATFSQIVGMYKFGGGYVTGLANWKDVKNSQYILQFWDKDFKKLGYVDFDAGTILAVHNDMLITANLDEETTKLEFWEFQL